MSSLVRRIQKNIAKGQGFRRHESDGTIRNSDGDIHNNPKPVYNKAGDVVSHRWPQVKAPTKKVLL